MIINSELTILIVDDQKTNIEMVKAILDDEEYQIAEATSGKMTLEITFNKKIDLILLDINMPEMDGFEVCERLKKDNNTKDIPIIFLSGDTSSEAITKAFSLGGVDYIRKPFNSLELIARVNTHLTIRKYMIENSAKQTRLAQLVSIDPQTKAFNRLKFTSSLKQLIVKSREKKQALSLVYIQINNLSKVNKMFNTKKGDQVLAKFAKITSGCIRKSDIFARIYGAQFAIILPKTPLNIAQKIANNITSKLNSELFNDSSASCSIVVTKNEDMEDMDEFISRTSIILKES
ncbi:MAG: response regulator [Helicobacteraceae bacterium]|nr:response regulator [Helicobacteraceae bacterium]